MICKKCDKRYDSTWKICLNCNEPLVDDLAGQTVQVKVDTATSGIANPNYYLKQFKKFDQNNGRFCFTWNWSAAFFNWIWQLCRNLWAKWLVYTIAFASLSFLVQYLPIEFMIIGSIGLWIFGFIFYGCVSNYDYYLKKTRNENLWSIFPYARFKWLFWVLVLLTVSGWIFYTAQNMKAMSKIAQSMSHPVPTTGETYEADGIKYTPPKGWQILGQFPQPMPGIRIKNEKLFLISEVDEKGQQKSNKFGQVTLFIGWPKKGQKFESLDQEEIKKMIGTTSSFQKNPMFKIMPFEAEAAEPEYVTLNDRQWLKTYQAFGPKGQADKVMSMTYYTVIANRLIVLGINGSAAEKNWASEQIEKFATTFKSN